MVQVTHSNLCIRQITVNDTIGPITSFSVYILTQLHVRLFNNTHTFQSVSISVLTGIISEPINSVLFRIKVREELSYFVYICSTIEASIRNIPCQGSCSTQELLFHLTEILSQSNSFLNFLRESLNASTILHFLVVSLNELLTKLSPHFRWCSCMLSKVVSVALSHFTDILSELSLHNTLSSREVQRNTLSMTLCTLSRVAKHLTAKVSQMIRHRVGKVAVGITKVLRVFHFTADIFHDTALESSLIFVFYFSQCL